MSAAPEPTPPRDDPRWGCVLARSPAVVSRTILDERLLVPIRGHLADLQCLYSLGGIGAFVWDALDGRVELRQLLETLVSRYDAPEDVLARDLLEFVAQLEDAALVTRSA